MDGVASPSWVLASTMTVVRGGGGGDPVAVDGVGERLPLVAWRWAAWRCGAWPTVARCLRGAELVGVGLVQVYVAGVGAAHEICTAAGAIG